MWTCPQFWVTMKGTRPKGTLKTRPRGLCLWPGENQHFFLLSSSLISCSHNGIWAAADHSFPWKTPCSPKMFSSFKDEATLQDTHQLERRTTLTSRTGSEFFLHQRSVALAWGGISLLTLRNTRYDSEGLLIALFILQGVFPIPIYKWGIWGLGRNQVTSPRSCR